MNESHERTKIPQRFKAFAMELAAVCEKHNVRDLKAHVSASFESQSMDNFDVEWHALDAGRLGRVDVSTTVRETVTLPISNSPNPNSI